MDPSFAFNYYEYNNTAFIASCIATSPTYADITVPTITTATCPNFGTSCCQDIAPAHQPVYVPRPANGTGNLVSIATYEHSIDSMSNFIDLGNKQTVLGMIGNTSISNGQLKDYLLSSKYLSNEVLINTINRSPAMGDRDLRQVLLQNSGLSKSVLAELILKNPNLANDKDLLQAQVTLSGRDDLMFQIKGILNQRNEVLKEMTDNYIKNEDWKDAAQLYVSKQAWEIAMSFYIKGHDINNANLMAQNILDADERKIALLYINHYANRITGSNNNTSVVDTLSADEKQTLAGLAANPYSHPGEWARKWLDIMTGKKFLEVMPADSVGNNAWNQAANTNIGNPAVPNSAASGINVYPNPAHSLVTIALKNGTWGNNANIQVYDINGKQIIKSVPESNKSTLDINISTLIPGVYMMVVQQSNGDMTTERLVVDTQ